MKALQVNQTDHHICEIIDLAQPIPESGEVLVKISYSSLNYKDALALTEKGGVIRSYPTTPGIDLAGTVVKSCAPEFKAGDLVFATGYELGVSRNGGYSEYQVVPAKWLFSLPEKLSLKEVMGFGTAGLTAALCIAELTRKVTPEQPVLVTGATGGVGSLVVALLRALGYEKISIISRKEKASALLEPVCEIYTPENFLSESKPLNRQLFAGVVDTVGGELLAKILPHVSYGGVVTACGNAGGIKLTTTVLPFILRGVTLAGIDSVNATTVQRKTAWDLLAQHKDSLSQLPLQEISLEEVPTVAQSLLSGTHSGRTIVKVEGE